MDLAEIICDGLCRAHSVLALEFLASLQGHHKDVWTSAESMKKVCYFPFILCVLHVYMGVLMLVIFPWVRACHKTLELADFLTKLAASPSESPASVPQSAEVTGHARLLHGSWGSNLMPSHLSLKPTEPPRTLRQSFKSVKTNKQTKPQKWNWIWQEAFEFLLF